MRPASSPNLLDRPADPDPCIRRKAIRTVACSEWVGGAVISTVVESHDHGETAMSARLSRRTLLAGLAAVPALALVGCDDDRTSAAPNSTAGTLDFANRLRIPSTGRVHNG
jgi:hypothetical protein